MRGSLGLKGCSVISSTLGWCPGLYPRRTEGTVLAIIPSAEPAFKGRGGWQSRFPDRCDSRDTKIVQIASLSSFLATPLQSWVNWYCREGGKAKYSRFF